VNRNIAKKITKQRPENYTALPYFSQMLKKLLIFRRGDVGFCVVQNIVNTGKVFLHEDR